MTIPAWRADLAAPQCRGLPAAPELPGSELQPPELPDPKRPRQARSKGGAGSAEKRGWSWRMRTIFRTICPVTGCEPRGVERVIFLLRSLEPMLYTAARGIAAGQDARK